MIYVNFKFIIVSIIMLISWKKKMEDIYDIWYWMSKGIENLLNLNMFVYSIAREYKHR